MAKRKRRIGYRGEAALKELRKEQTRIKTMREQRAASRRWWLRSDEEGKMTILDNPVFAVYEHNIKIGDRWGNHFSCLRQIDEDCPLCEDGDRPGLIFVATVISHNKWVDNSGKVHNNEKMLLVLKGRAYENLMRRSKHLDEDLSLCLFNVARGSSPTECRTGEDFQFLKRLTKKDLAKIKPADVEESVKEWLQPFDYEEIFEPKSRSEILAILGKDSEGIPGADEDEEPEETEETEEDNSDSEEEDDSDDEGDTSDFDDAEAEDDLGEETEEEPEEEPEEEQKPKKKAKPKPKPKPKAASGKKGAKAPETIDDLL